MHKRWFGLHSGLPHRRCGVRDLWKNLKPAAIFRRRAAVNLDKNLLAIPPLVRPRLTRVRSGGGLYGWLGGIAD